ncbi:MAG: hypothetical protein HUJ88_12945 [Fusobacterium necrophorum]|nr:hypothetical protein [Fusobacterium necrophorum]
MAAIILICIGLYIWVKIAKNDEKRDEKQQANRVEQEQQAIPEEKKETVTSAIISGMAAGIATYYILWAVVIIGGLIWMIRLVKNS